MLTMIHSNSAKIEDGYLYVDRKFLDGMSHYATFMGVPLTTIHPEKLSNEVIMDMVKVSLDDLKFKIITVKSSDKSEREKFEKIIINSTMIYGTGLNFAEVAAKNSIPYVLIEEYDLSTKISVSVNAVQNKFRRFVRSLRIVYKYYSAEVPAMRNAYSIHCNGYPVYDESARYNKNRLLYLDSRMTSDNLISEENLKARLIESHSRPMRLLYSGRYEKIKGSADAVKVAIECQKMGLDIEFHAYGQGSLREEMQRLAQSAPRPDRIFIHGAIPFPDLIVKSRDFDLFICCHIQSDPSCTYLETFGSGLPIVGYNNKMFERLTEESQVGFATHLGNPFMVAESVAHLIQTPSLLSTMSYKARAFCETHVFENEFKLRVDALKNAYQQLS